MSASKFVEQAARSKGLSGTKSLSRAYDLYSCHPQAWGLKKGLRRGRRRLNKIIIERELNEYEQK